jgi:C4-dicarboxylate transporter, DctM subunit
MLVVGLLLLGLAMAGTPLFVLMGALALYLFVGAGIDPAVLIVELFRLGDFPALVAVPFFTFAGYTLAESQAPRRLVALMQALVGWMPGGMAVVALVASAVFTAFTGVSGVTIIALGGLLYPVLVNHGYPEHFSLGLITTSGSLGLLFPPSLPIILYSLVARTNVDALFAAAFIPGVLLLVALSLYAVVRGMRENIEKIPFSWKALRVAVRDASWELPLPVIVIGGIYGGFFTATEAAAVTAAYAIVVECGIRRELSLRRDLPRTIQNTMVLVGAIFVMLGAAVGLTNYLVDQEIPTALLQAASTIITTRWQFLLVLNLFLLVVNMIEIFSAIILVAPIIIPIASQYGIQPIHLGIIFLLNLEIGYMCPPLGLNIFLSSLRFTRRLPEIYRAVMPFLVILLVILLVVVYVPSLSLAIVPGTR